MNDFKGLESLVVRSLLADLQIGRSRLVQLAEPIKIQCFENHFIKNEHIIEYDFGDLTFYQEVIELLIKAFPHYPDILGDFIYQMLNERVHHDVLIDRVCTHCVNIRCWRSFSNGMAITAYIMASDIFRGVVFETGSQWLTLIKYNRESWSFFASRKHTSDLAIYPYVCDLFTRGRVETLKESKPISAILDLSLPDWYPLNKCKAFE